MSNPTTSETTHIAKSTVIKGEVRLEGPATIAGRIEGRVFGKDVDLNADAAVEGDIACTAIELNGNVKGNINAAKSCKLGATARVTGEIRTANLGIAEGATFVGQVFVGAPAKTDSPAPAESAPAGRIDAASDDANDSVNVLAGNVQNSLNRNKVAPRPYTAGAR